ncbi:unnamed protein product [Acidithrix sp. C25]|nr:unnamed protein product [Acidithrix sp. C25]
MEVGDPTVAATAEEEEVEEAAEPQAAKKIEATAANIAPLL